MTARRTSLFAENFAGAPALSPEGEAIVQINQAIVHLTISLMNGSPHGAALDAAISRLQDAGAVLEGLSHDAILRPEH